MSNTRIIVLPEEIYTYLLKHVFEQHLGRGISSSELQIAAETHHLLLKAQTVDYSKLGNAKLGIKPDGVELDLETTVGRSGTSSGVQRGPDYVAIDLVPEKPKSSPNGEF